MGSRRADDTMAVPHSPATSQILTERLQARRMDSKRSRRRTDFGPIRPIATEEDDVFMAEAEASTTHTENDFTRSRRSQPGNVKAAQTTTRAPGLKEMDDKLQKLEKQNFDLKMEVFHRREREEKLHDQLRKMHDQVILAQKIQKEHATLMELNGNLVQELDKANEAVDQAVQMICDLETRVEMLQQRQRLPSAHSDSGYGESTAATTTITPPTPPSKQYLSSGGSPLGRLRPHAVERTGKPQRDRVPSFMSDTGSGTLALREAYAGTTRNLREAMSFVSILSESTAKDGDKLNDLGSPRLSMLSESSFPSIYDLGKSRSEAADESPVQDVYRISSEETPRRDYREDSVKKVSNWVRQGQNLNVRQPELQAEVHGRHSTDESRRASNASSDFEPGYAGYPDGGSIVRGTPSRFRDQSELRQDIVPTTSINRQDYQRRKSSAEVYLHVQSQQDRPYYTRAETSPVVEESQDMTRQDWPLANQPRQDSIHSERVTTPTKTNVSRRNSTRASLAAKTQRLWGRLSTGARESTSPPPKPRIENRRPLTKSATAADVSQPSARGSNTSSQMSLGIVGMHYAVPTQASSRRRSADAGVQRQRVPTMSKNGAQAAWENKAGRYEGGERRDRASRA